ncbi:sigma-54-dependent Fis family transcriptional regulator, partial [Bacillus sp. SIMBA_069]
MSKEAKLKLRSYSWPGNVRELQGILMQACFLSETYEIAAEHIQLEGLEEAVVSQKAEETVQSLREMELQAIKKAL